MIVFDAWIYFSIHNFHLNPLFVYGCMHELRMETQAAAIECEINVEQKNNEQNDKGYEEKLMRNREK